MTLISIVDVRKALGDAFSSEPSEDTIQFFINQQEEELKELIGVEDLSSAPHQALLKRWLLNKVCSDVLRQFITSKVDQPLDYAIGELREDFSKNVEKIREWIEIMEQSADQALKQWFSYRGLIYCASSSA